MRKYLTALFANQKGNAYVILTIALFGIFFVSTYLNQNQLGILGVQPDQVLSGRLNPQTENFCKKCSDEGGRCNCLKGSCSCGYGQTLLGRPPDFPGSEDSDPSHAGEIPILDCSLLETGQRPACKANNDISKTKNSDSNCSNRLTYCDGRHAIRKTSGYLSNVSLMCVYNYYHAVEKDNSCSGQPEGKLITEDPDKAKDRDQATLLRNDTPLIERCPSASYCLNNKVIRRVSTPPALDTEACTDEYPSVPDTDTRCSGKPDMTIIAGNDNTKREAMLALWATQRKDLSDFLNSSKDLVSGIDKIKTAYDSAFVELANAEAKSALCVDDSSCNTAQNSQTLAVAKSRLGLAYALAQGIPGITLKIDLSVGDKQMNARPISTRPVFGSELSRVIVKTQNTASGTVVFYYARNLENELAPANLDTLNANGPGPNNFTFRQGQSYSELAGFLQSRINNLESFVRNPS